MTTVHVVLLGLLQHRPLHGYELKHIIEEHMGDWTDIKFGSIYFALKKLNDQGKVEILEESQSGGRPSRKIYQITDLGKKEYLTLLKALWTEKKRTHYSLDIALFFIDALPKDEVISFLDARIEQYEHTLHYLTEHEKNQLANPQVPHQATYIINHSVVHLTAELEWLKRIKQDIIKK